MTISEFIRPAAIYGKVIARLTEEERHFIRQLVGMANNFNQMAKPANTEGLSSTRLLLESCLQPSHGLLNKLQHGECISRPFLLSAGRYVSRKPGAELLDYLGVRGDTIIN